MSTISSPFSTYIFLYNKDHLIEELVTLNALAPKAVTNEYNASDRYYNLP